MCARLEGVAKKLEARSAGAGEAQLRAILLEHQSSLEAQQLAQTKKLRDEIRSLADVQRQQALSMSSIVSSLANLEARGGGGGGSGGGGAPKARRAGERGERGGRGAATLHSCWL